MAQNINLPIAFEWFPQPASWDVVTAEVMGWALESAQTEPHLLAKVEQRGMCYHLEVPWWAFPLETLRLLRQEKTREFRPSYSLDLLVCSAEMPHGKKREANPWPMRQEFLRLKQDPKALLAFLNKWGTWGSTRSLALWGPPRTTLPPPTEVKLPEWSRWLLPAQLDPKRVPADILALVGEDNAESILDRTALNCLLPFEIWTFQKQCRDALGKPAHKWLPTQKLLELIPRERYPHYVLNAVSCQRAILNTILIDLLRKVKFRLCARPDCRTPFAIESRHQREYCCQYCAHIESVRKQRAAKKEVLQEGR